MDGPCHVTVTFVEEDVDILPSSTRCQDRKGSFMVETTKWEGTASHREQQNAAQIQGKSNVTGASAAAGPVASKTTSSGDWVNDWQTED